MRGKIVPDPKIVQNVSRRLSTAGVRAPSRVVVSCRNGDVALTGTIQYEHQRQAAMQSAKGVEGVRRVLDQLQLKPAERRH